MKNNILRATRAKGKKMEHEGDRKVSSSRTRRPMIWSSNADDDDDFSSLPFSLSLSLTRSFRLLCLLYFKRKTDVATGFLFIRTKSERKRDGKEKDGLWCVKNVSHSICFVLANEDGQTRYELDQ